jgi:hypothetical protein
VITPPRITPLLVAYNRPAKVRLCKFPDGSERRAGVADQRQVAGNFAHCDTTYGDDSTQLAWERQTLNNAKGYLLFLAMGKRSLALCTSHRRLPMGE